MATTSAVVAAAKIAQLGFLHQVEIVYSIGGAP
jgi:hypothetical protein